MSQPTPDPTHGDADKADPIDESPGSGDQLSTLAQSLQAAGIDPGELGQLAQEQRALAAPVGLFGRLTRRAREMAQVNWKHLVAELQESREVMTLIRVRVTGERPLSDEERDMVRSQLLDLLKVVPAGLVAAVNYALPVPFTSFLTPWLLFRLGLMPSRWREAHLIHQLQREAARLKAAGHTDAAARVEAIEERIEREADAREEARTRSQLLSHWDANNNGTWDDDERAAYESELRRLRRGLEKIRVHKRWFLRDGEQVYGPVRLSQFTELPQARGLLVCYDGKSGWVELSRLVDGV